MASDNYSKFYIVVIGADAAGLLFTAVAAQLGLRVALVEQEDMGGDYLNVGCVLSKAPLAGAHAAIEAPDAGRFGVRLPAPVIDWPAVRAHVQGAIDVLAPMGSEARFSSLGAKVFRGQARFVVADAIQVNGQTLQASRFVAAAGSYARVPAIAGLDLVPYLTHVGIFRGMPPPRHLVIVGGGSVGLETAHPHAGLGIKVALIQSGRIAPKEEPGLVDGLRGALAALGVTVLEDARVTAAEVLPTEDGVPGVRLVLADGE